MTLRSLLRIEKLSAAAIAKAQTGSGDDMNAFIRRTTWLVLIALLTSGCGAADDTKPSGCGAPQTEQASPKTNNQEACVLGHKNTQSSDRKW
ncbi:hypothetical protein PSE10B_30450 [Pseudomonas amygdali pv. eriobotryae]|nr:hypothetical protein PSE10B_30450 [Pseudomonas amygdali pv. eriobotryae]